ncbi:MAG: hypothetical protein AAF211_20875 [Myxococcota bacterium]
MIAIRRGHVEVLVDEARECVYLTHRRRVAHVLHPIGVRTLGWLFVLGALLTVVAALVGLGPPAVGVAAVLAVLAIVAFVVSQQFDTFPPIRIDGNRRDVWVGEQRFDLDRTLVCRTRDAGWTLAPTPFEGNIGAAWGASGIGWLKRVRHLVAAGQLDRISLVDPPMPSRPPPTLDRVTVSFASDPSGLRATTGQPESEFVNSPALRFVVAFLVGVGLLDWVNDGHTRALPWFAAYGLFFAIDGLHRYVRRRKAHRRRHTRVQLDNHALHYVEGDTRHRVLLADVEAIHRGLRALQIDRHDGTSLTVGHGWDSEGLDRLATEIERAMASPAARQGAELPAIPEALDRLRRTSGRRYSPWPSE